MRYVFSTHAENEMARRRITAEQVKSVLNSPEQVVAERNERHAYQSRLDFGDAGRLLLRVIVDDDVDPAVVVTVYRTSRIEKYWRR